MNWKLLIPFVLILALQVQDNCFASETSPVTVVSPTDGSLWMATESDGLLRFGRNGHVLKYDVAAQSLVFDASGTLYILDDSGALTRYTSIEGFSAVPSFESGVGALSESAGTAVFSFRRCPGTCENPSFQCLRSFITGV